MLSLIKSQHHANRAVFTGLFAASIITLISQNNVSTATTSVVRLN